MASLPEITIHEYRTPPADSKGTEAEWSVGLLNLTKAEVALVRDMVWQIKMLRASSPSSMRGWDAKYGQVPDKPGLISPAPGSILSFGPTVVANVMSGQFEGTSNPLPGETEALTKPEPERNRFAALDLSAVDKAK